MVLVFQKAYFFSLPQPDYRQHSIPGGKRAFSAIPCRRDETVISVVCIHERSSNIFHKSRFFNLKALAKFQLNYCLPENSPIKLGLMYLPPPLHWCAAVAGTAKSFLGFIFKLAHFRVWLRISIH